MGRKTPHHPPPQPDPIDWGWLKGEVERVLERNRVTQVRGWKGRQEVTYHAPSLAPPPGGVGRIWWILKEPWQVRYPHQWFWDSTAHAVVLSLLHPELAKREIESLLYAQEESGFIPHVIWNPSRIHLVDRLLRRLYPGDHTSPYLQPPNLAEAVEKIYQETGDLDFVRKVLPGLKGYYLYLERARGPQGDSLPEIISSYESGKDRSREYDPVYGESNIKPVWRGPMAKLMLKHRALGWDTERILKSDRFRVKDLLFVSVYAQNLFALSRLCAATGEGEGALYFKERALVGEASILSKMHDQESGLFYSLDARGGRDEPLRVSTISSLLPLTLDGISQDQVERLVRGHLSNPEEFWLEYPLPSEPLSLPPERIKGRVIWRGQQTWIYLNWYIARGLRKQAARFPERSLEFNGIADDLTLRTYKMVQREGFWEYYHSLTGRGGGAQDFGPSTLLLDMLYNRAAKSPPQGEGKWPGS